LIIDSKDYGTEFGTTEYTDNNLLGCAKSIINGKSNPVAIVSQDINLRLRAKSAEIGAINHGGNKSTIDEIYSGIRTIVDERSGAMLKEEYQINCYENEELEDLLPNECVIFVNPEGKTIAYGRRRGDKIKFVNGTRAWGIGAKNVEQAMALDMLMDPGVHLVSLAGIAGTGKAQPLTSNVLTPNGYVKMGDVKPNDFVIGSDGKPKKVISIYPQGKKEIYQVTFSDGTATECCKEHLWFTQTCYDRWNNKEGSVKSLEEIKETLIKYGKRNHSIPMVRPVEFIEKDVPLDPYLMGALLGDGGFSQNSIIISSQDEEIINRFNEKLPEKLTLVKKSNSKYDYYITKGTRFGERTNELKEVLKSLDLMGLKSEEKFIPDVYKYNSAKIRHQILIGLMDTDGFCGKGKKVENCFYSTSKRLAEDVVFLARSLGCKSTIKEKQTSYTYDNEKKRGKLSFVVYISPPANLSLFSISRKLDRFTPRSKYQPTKYIDKIELVGEKEAQCIYIDSEDHLYVTDDFILTHNTLLSMAAGIESVVSLKIYDKMEIYRPFQPVGKDIGYLPGDLSEKLDPWMGAIRDSIDALVPNNRSSDTHRRKNAAVGPAWHNNMAQFSDQIHLEALTYLRGRSIANTFILIDETQNITKEEIKTILTRAGENSKIVLTGDIEQIDDSRLDAMNNGLTYTIDKFKNSELAGHVSLREGVRSPLAAEAARLL
jgi:predicted ribonuclease YlaK